MNTDILSRINQRDKLLSQYKKDCNNVSLFREFSKLRNAIQRDIKMAKQQYFNHKVEQNRGNSGKLWQQLKSLGYSNKGSDNSTSIVLEDDGEKVFEPAKVAGIFNRFFTGVASNLVNALPSPSGLFNIINDNFRGLHFSRMRYRNSFSLSPVSRHYIRKQLTSTPERPLV